MHATHGRSYGVIEADHKAAVLREQRLAELRVVEERSPAPESAFDFADFTRKVFDGAVGDFDLPFPSYDHARLAVECALTNRFHRHVTPNEYEAIVQAVAHEWVRSGRTPAGAPENHP